MQTVRRGLLAGVYASLVLAMFDFVTDGAPGNGLPSVLHWFGLTMADSTISHWGGFFLLVVLGGVFGLIFGILQRDRLITAGRALLAGLALGVLWWLIFELVLTNIMNHASSPFSSVLGASFPRFPSTCFSGCCWASSTSNGRNGLQAQRRRRGDARHLELSLMR